MVLPKKHRFTNALNFFAWSNCKSACARYASFAGLPVDMKFWNKKIHMADRVPIRIKANSFLKLMKCQRRLFIKDFPKRCHSPLDSSTFVEINLNFFTGIHGIFARFQTSWNSKHKSEEPALTQYGAPPKYFMCRDCQKWLKAERPRTFMSETRGTAAEIELDGLYWYGPRRLSQYSAYAGKTSEIFCAWRCM